ncbi:DUF3592 domain-containing protein [Streptomyces sp. I05A-00742]|uniref:DUF3592 domain-containing protein n=1 Tax=Streptomyces sp. I05A-00742 TaxID=2732853 RepID=UPI0014884DD4|nr:DUF3592 domain-containing protein [Streptomyces sp. I05A-00742]
MSWFGGNAGWIFYVFIMTVLFGALIWPFGIRPLLVARRLRRVGVKAEAECVDCYWSESRVSERFDFVTSDGIQATYRTALRGRRIAETGEIVDLLYDPQAPNRRARTVRELSVKSQAGLPLWGGIALVVVINLYFLAIWL